MRYVPSPAESTKPRVAYFAGSMKPGHDGVTRVLYRLIDALVAEGIPNVFYSPIVPSPGGRSTEMVEVPSLTIPMYKDYRFAIPGQRHFESHLVSFAPDLIHINSPCPLGHAAVQFGLAHGVPVVATYHTHFPSYARYYNVRPLTFLGWNYMRRLYNNCQRVYVPSEPILRELAGKGMNTLKYLPHGVDTQAFHPHFRSRVWKDMVGIGRKAALLFVGRLVWEKDLATLAEAYALLAAKRDDAAFVIVGDGPIRDELRQMMPDAKFLGYRSGEELATVYASSDLFVFPSTTETFGNVTLEAMASGLTPVCVREGGASGVVQDGITGLLARPRDAADLAAKIEMLLDNPGMRSALADRALRFARLQTWNRIFGDLFEDYDEVLREFRHIHPLRQRKVA